LGRAVGDALSQANKRRGEFTRNNQTSLGKKQTYHSDIFPHLAYPAERV
jgi:hypothetical protein